MQKYIKYLPAILAFVLLCFFLIFLRNRSETLDDYAAKQPELAYPAKEPSVETLEAAEAAEQTASKETETSMQKEEQAMNHSTDRITFQPDFYYESLSEELKKRIYGLSYKEDCTVSYEDLRYVSIRYVNFKGIDSTGEIICNKAIAQDLVEIFYELFQSDYQIEQIRLIDEYNADDNLSMQDNNTSCFNYRAVPGSAKLSKHAQGLAIDINPFFNPYVTYHDGKEQITPTGSEYYADRTKTFAYKIDEDDLCYKLFTAHGFTWGGNWNSCKDYQHFEKSLQP